METLFCMPSFLLQLPLLRNCSCFWCCHEVEDQTQATTSMARTNLRDANDQRPLPRGIGSLPALPRRRSRRRPAPQPRPPPLSPPSQHLHVRPRSPSLLGRIAEYRDQLAATRLAQIRHNMKVYDSQYPAAVQVRTHLGVTVWELLELQRSRIVRFACIMRKLDREECPVARFSLDRRFSALEDYVEEACGKYMKDNVFKCLHDRLENVIEEEAAMDIGIQDGLLMSTMRELFHHQPFLWFLYNFYFPVKGRRGDPGRMSWVQQKDWAIWTLQNPMEEPSWFSWLKEEDQVPLKAVSTGDLIWNAAMIEAFTDVGARFDP